MASRSNGSSGGAFDRSTPICREGRARLRDGAGRILWHEYQCSRFAMDHSAPILANFEALPDMLTAENLEALLQIDRKTIYAYVQKGLIPHSRIEIECPLLETPGPGVARRAQLPAPTGEWQGRKAPMTDLRRAEPNGQPPHVAQNKSQDPKAPRCRSGLFLLFACSQHSWGVLFPRPLHRPFRSRRHWSYLWEQKKQGARALGEF